MVVKKPTRPARQVCPLCASDDLVTLRSDGPDIWVFVCGAEQARHPYEWTPTGTPQFEPGRVGIAEELGVYDDLLRCLEPGERVEYGIVEYRFAATSPMAYRALIERYGHVSVQPSKYTASAFLSHALGQLSREGLVELSWTKGTGYWSYLTRVSAWSLAGSGAAVNVPILNWADFALGNGLDPESWTSTAVL